MGQKKDDEAIRRMKETFKTKQLDYIAELEKK